MKTNISVKELNALCQGYDVFPTPEQLAALQDYLSLLMQWNRVMNLVGSRTWQAAFHTLLIDSMYLVSFLDSLPLAEEPQIWDLGAGAGLPGIPLRIFWQKGNYFLVESREKRALFLSTVLARAPVAQTHVWRGRAETFMESHVPADLIVSRAFMPWMQLLELVQNHISPQGLIVFLMREPMPLRLPAGWKSVSSREYLVKSTNTPGKDTRYFWALEHCV